jgi:hypothetical protein
LTFCSHSLSQHCLPSSWKSIQQDASNYRQTCQINVLCYTKFSGTLGTGRGGGEKGAENTHSVYTSLTICSGETNELQFKNQQINFTQTTYTKTFYKTDFKLHSQEMKIKILPGCKSFVIFWRNLVQKKTHPALKFKHVRSWTPIS